MKAQSSLRDEGIGEPLFPVLKRRAKIKLPLRGTITNHSFV